MKKLTFCAFSANDGTNIQEQTLLFINSLLKQDTDESCVLFFDCSTTESKFKLPEHPSLTVVHNPITDPYKWNRSIIRNEIALRADTPIICQVCADCCYSPNFASTLIKEMGDGNKCLCCRRRTTSQDQFKQILKDNSIVPQMAPKLSLDSQAPCGECQCMMREQFIELGGYYKLIRNNKCSPGVWNKTAGRDDTDLMWQIRKDRHYKNTQHTITEKWIEDISDVWIVHMWHPERQHSKKWNQERG